MQQKPRARTLNRMHCQPPTLVGPKLAQCPLGYHTAMAKAASVGFLTARQAAQGFHIVLQEMDALRNNRMQASREPDRQRSGFTSLGQERGKAPSVGIWPANAHASWALLNALQDAVSAGLAPQQAHLLAQAGDCR